MVFRFPIPPIIRRNASVFVNIVPTCACLGSCIREKKGRIKLLKNPKTFTPTKTGFSCVEMKMISLAFALLVACMIGRTLELLGMTSLPFLYTIQLVQTSVRFVAMPVKSSILSS
jgi:hypothetical protein